MRESSVDWVLGHQFLRIHRIQVEGPAETVIHVGYDTVSERYVLIRLDSFNARGVGDDRLRDSGRRQAAVHYEYPSGPFKETWSWDGKEKSWQFTVESKVQGTWTVFSSFTLHRVRGRGGPPPFPPQ